MKRPSSYAKENSNADGNRRLAALRRAGRGYVWSHCECVGVVRALGRCPRPVVIEPRHHPLICAKGYIATVLNLAEEAGAVDGLLADGRPWNAG